MLRDLASAVRFGWGATRGSRWRPWRSPYVRWRVETYSGQKAETVGLADCLELLLAERKQFRRFAGWLTEMRALRSGKGTAAPV